MGESSMLSTMLMETMVAPSWRLNMMGRLTTLSSMDMLGVVSLPIIFNLHDGATIVSISMVDNMLDSSIRKV